MPAPRLAMPASVALAACLALPLAAQRTDTARVDSLRPAVRLAPLVATGTRLPARADRLGFALSVVDSARLAKEPPLFAADALRALPAAHIDEAAGTGGPTIIRLRGGEEVFTQVLVDGVKMNQNGGFFDFQGLTLGGFDRIEVARGPQSALYGSSAMSGVVQFFTRRGQPGPARLSGTWEGGGATERGRGWRGTAAAGGGSEAVQWAASAGATYDRGIYSQPHDLKSREAALRLDASPASRWAFTASAWFTGVDANHPIRDPGATRVPQDPNARIERDRLVGVAEARFAPTAALTQSLRASTYREDFVYDDEKDGVTSPDFFIFDATFRLDSELRRHTIEYGGSWMPGASPVTFAYGAQWEREELAEETSGEFGDGSQSLHRTSGAAFAEARAELGGRLALTGGVRAEGYRGIPTEITPRAGLAWQAVPGTLTLRAAAGRGYKAPNLQEQYLSNPFIAGNPDLEPERSTSWEAGADVRSGDASFGVTWFRQEFRDLIRTVPLEGTTQQINRNLGESLAEGVEWTARWAPSPRWAVGTEGAWIQTEVRENVGLSPDQFPVGEPLPGRPDAVGSAWVELNPTERLGLVLRATGVGEQTVLSERFSGQRVELDPYVLASVNAQYRFSRGLALYARVQNLLDAEYETAFDRPGAPLTAALGVRAGR